MMGVSKPSIRKIMGYIWFIATFIWLFAAIGVAFFDYDPGVGGRTVAFLLSAAYFYSLYEKAAKSSTHDESKGFE
ncbi:hypothetical protein RKD55_004612 [Rossellomorea marisflavi]